jgi:hypothetical protein
MPTNTFTCAYSMTAVGAVPVATMAARFAAVPVDLAIPNLVGLLYAADATATVGQVITRTITLRARPTTDATASALRFAGDVSGSPIKSLILGLPGADYAAPPIVDLSSGAPNRAGTAVARMGVNRGIVIAGGTGYVAPTIAFTGGGLPLGGVQATATIAQIGGVLQAPVITSVGGPYQVPPIAVVTDSGGSGGIISPSLLVTAIVLGDPGFGYETAPTPAFVPFFSSCCPDTQPTSQIAMVISWMTAVFQAALRTPIKATLPVIA